MASRKPIVLNSGNLEQLQSGDSLTVGDYDLPAAIGGENTIMVSISGVLTWATWYSIPEGYPEPITYPGSWFLTWDDDNTQVVWEWDYSLPDPSGASEKDTLRIGALDSFEWAARGVNLTSTYTVFVNADTEFEGTDALTFNGTDFTLKTGSSLIGTDFTSSYFLYANASKKVTASNQIQLGATRPYLPYGLSAGYNSSANWSGPGIVAYVFQRSGNLDGGIMLDYQDSLAYAHLKGTATLTPSPDYGSVSFLTRDDSNYVYYNIGSTIGTVVYEVIPTTAIPVNNDQSSWKFGFTFRHTAAESLPNHILIEICETAGGTYRTVYDEDTPAVESYGQLITPKFSTVSPYTIGKIRITFTLDNPLVQQFRLQRVMLYHASETYDPWHLHVGGGTMYGNLNLNTGIALTSSDVLYLIPYTGKAVQTSTSGNTRGASAVDLQSVRLYSTEVASGDYSVIGGGQKNTAGGTGSTTSGGVNNYTVGNYSTIGGGVNNILSSGYSTIAGGVSNDATDGSSYNYLNTVGGGQDNSIVGGKNTICGGLQNTISIATVGAGFSFIGGGQDNTIAGTSSVICGGYLNSIGYNYNFIGGGRENVIPSESIGRNVITGGYQNSIITASTNNGYNFIGGGQENDIQGQYSVIAGGALNTITLAAGSRYANILGGAGNAITAASYASIVGGYYNESSAPYTTIFSSQYAKAIHYGQQVQASGRFSSTGDAQTSILVARKQTTDDTLTELFLDGSTERLTIAEGEAWFYTIKCVARQTNGDYTVCGWHEEGLVSRDSGGNITVLNQTSVATYLNDMSWSFAVSADTSNQSLKMAVQGVTDETINWVARIELVEVTG